MRHHTVLDSRVAFNVEELVRLVAAYGATDRGQGLAMADWREEGDTVAPQVVAEPSSEHALLSQSETSNSRRKIYLLASAALLRHGTARRKRERSAVGLAPWPAGFTCQN